MTVLICTWQVDRFPSLTLQLNEILRWLRDRGWGEVCTGHSRSSRLLCLLFWMMGKINETRALIPSTQSFIILAKIVNKNFSFFKVLLSCQMMSLMNNDLRAECCCLCCCGCQSDIVEWLIIIWWSELGEVSERTSWCEEQPQQFGKMSKLLCHAATLLGRVVISHKSHQGTRNDDRSIVSWSGRLSWIHSKLSVEYYFIETWLL